MNRFVWLLRREAWEHRAIWIAPLVVIGLLLLGAVTGNVFLGDVKIDADVTIDGSSGEANGLTDEDVKELSSIRGPEDLHKLERLEKLEKVERKEIHVMSPGEAVSRLPAEKREGVLLIVYAAVAALMFMVLGIIGFFYSLEALYADRRDRSVLFWKSLPLSDTETVLSKFVVAAVVIPLLAAAAAVVGQLVVALGGSIKLAMTGGEALMMFSPQAFGGSAVTVLVLAVISSLWYAPVVAYLLLASSWAPKAPFLWAVLPPVALAMTEKVAFGSNEFALFIKHRLIAPLEALFNDGSVQAESARAAGMIGNVLDLVISPGMLLGLVAAAALLVAAVWLRRYRDETT